MRLFFQSSCPWLASRWPFGTASTLFSFPTAIQCEGQKATAEDQTLSSCVSFCSKCATASKIICALDVVCYTVNASITEAVHYLGPFPSCYFSFQTLDITELFSVTLPLPSCADYVMPWGVTTCPSQINPSHWWDLVVIATCLKDGIRITRLSCIS